MRTLGIILTLAALLDLAVVALYNALSGINFGLDDILRVTTAPMSIGVVLLMVHVGWNRYRR